MRQKIAGVLILLDMYLYWSTLRVMLGRGPTVSLLRVKWRGLILFFLSCAAKYVSTQTECIRQFITSQRREEVERMKKFAATLMLFANGFQDCMKVYVEEALDKLVGKVNVMHSDCHVLLEEV